MQPKLAFLCISFALAVGGTNAQERAASNALSAVDVAHAMGPVLDWDSFWRNRKRYTAVRAGDDLPVKVAEFDDHWVVLAARLGIWIRYTRTADGRIGKALSIGITSTRAEREGNGVAFSEYLDQLEYGCRLMSTLNSVSGSRLQRVNKDTDSPGRDVIGGILSGKCKSLPPHPLLAVDFDLSMPSLQPPPYVLAATSEGVAPEFIAELKRRFREYYPVVGKVVVPRFSDDDPTVYLYLETGTERGVIWYSRTTTTHRELSNFRQELPHNDIGPLIDKIVRLRATDFSLP